MTSYADVHAPVGGPILTRTFKILLTIAGIGVIAMIWRFLNGLGSVSNLSDGYPWGIWISIDVVVGTALGCGGYAVALLVYVLNRGKYHPLVRPAILTSLLGYGLAVLAVSVDLGRYWDLWKVPIFFWRWTHSPQLEVALCVALYNLVLLVELSPAAFEKWRRSSVPSVARFSEGWLRFVDHWQAWIVALGLLLPTMHQSSLGTMMLLTGPRLHPLWFTPWLPFLFLVNCIMMGYGVVTLEATFSSAAFRRPSESAMLAALGKVTLWVAAFWAAFRLVDVIVAGEASLVASWLGLWFLVEIGVHAAAIAILASPERRAAPGWQVRAALLLVLGGILYRVNAYLVAFRPGGNWNYFPAVPELLVTFGIIAAEIAIYIWAVKTFPILAGRHARTRG